jgi:hypothetical protein
MSTPQDVNLPKPPNDQNLGELVKWAQTMHIFLTNNVVTGNQHPFFSTAQLNQMVTNNDLQQAGKTFTNSDTGALTYAKVVAGNLTLQVL